MKTNIKIHLQDGKIEMQCSYVAMSKASIEVQNFFKEGSKAIIFERKHNFLQTQFILNQIAPCWLVVFDENKIFTTVKPHFYRGEAPFSMIIPEPIVLLLPADQRFDFEEIESIELSEIGEEDLI